MPWHMKASVQSLNLFEALNQLSQDILQGLNVYSKLSHFLGRDDKCGSSGCSTFSFPVFTRIRKNSISKNLGHKMVVMQLKKTRENRSYWRMMIWVTSPQLCIEETASAGEQRSHHNATLSNSRCIGLLLRDSHTPKCGPLPHPSHLPNSPPDLG